MIDKNEIMGLIDSKKEGLYWDFKKEWYKNNKDLLIDVLAFSNNLVDRDCYIIIGVDECNDYKIGNITLDENCKSTSNLVNFLKDIEFNGSIRPEVLVERIVFSDEQIVDVILIKNSYHTPFYLSKKQIEVNPFIFVRLQDCNSSRDRNADINHIEFLFKKRFGLTKSPLQQALFYLNTPNDWVSSPELHKEIKYYKFAPEFTIEVKTDERDGWDIFFLVQTDYNPGWGSIEIKYHQTVLEYVNLIYMDGARYCTACPSSECFNIGNDKYYINYYLKTDVNYLIYEFLNMKEEDGRLNIASYQFHKCVLFFDNEIQKKEFIIYVNSHIETFNEVYSNTNNRFNDINLEGYKMEEFEKRYKATHAIKQMYDNFINAYKK